jgi:hypothetical protein
MHLAIASATAVEPASWIFSRRVCCALSWIRTAAPAMTVTSPITAPEISSGMAAGYRAAADEAAGHRHDMQGRAG